MTRATQSSQPPAATPAAGYSVRRRVMLSVLLVFHVTAVFVAPFTFATSREGNAASPFAVGLMNSMRWYIDGAFLNHGYFFFAPNPGPSHLVRFDVTFADDRPTERFLMPDRRLHWPRLLYHRHFMLSETLNQRFAPPPPPFVPAEDQPALQNWKQMRELYERLRGDFANKVRVDLGAEQVQVTRVEHLLVTPDEFIDGLSIQDPRSYRDLSDEPPLPDPSRRMEPVEPIPAGG